MKFEKAKALDVDWGNRKEFFEKSEKERYKYFSNCMFHYFGLLQEMKRDKNYDFVIEKLFEIFANVSFFLVFLLTTEQEQKDEIELVWINRFQKENQNLEKDDGVYMDFEVQGKA